LVGYVDNYENVLKGVTDSYTSDFIKKELKKRITSLVDDEIDNLPWDQLEYQ